MSSSFIITESLLKKNGKKLMLDFYELVNDKDMLEIDEVKRQRKFYDDNAVNTYKKLFLPKHKLFKDLNTGTIFSRYSDDFTKLIDHVIINNKTHTEIEGVKVKELDDEEFLTFISDKIKDCSIDEKFVFELLYDMDKELKLDPVISFEINEDLHCLKSAFLKAYELFYHTSYNLKV